jgi:DNA-binding phage protein
MSEEILSEYAEYLSLGTINYLLDLIGEKENKSRRQVLEELGINRETLYHSTEAKKQVVKEAFKRLDPSIVIKTMYQNIKDIYTNFIIDLLTVTAQENEMTNLTKEVLEENEGLLKNVRDFERREIIRIVKKKVYRNNLRNYKE